MRIFGIAGWSGSGKTTLVTALIPEFVAHGISVSTVKHAHHGFDIDHPGKDSWRHRQAGACEVMVASDRRWALMHELRATSRSSGGSGASRNSCSSAQRRSEATMTSHAPAWRCRHESLPGRSTWKAWWACLTVDTVIPHDSNSGMSAVINVVLPLPLQPARPKIRIAKQRGSRPDARICGGRSGLPDAAR